MSDCVCHRIVQDSFSITVIIIVIIIVIFFTNVKSRAMRFGNPVDRFVLNYVCGAAAKAPCPLTDGQQSWAPLESSSTQWELRSFLAVLSEDPSIEERCQVWAANLILTFAVAAVVMLRIWWTCGNLPPSDSNYEPALGRVIHTGEPRDVDLPVGEERSTPFSVASFLQPTTLSSRWFRELARGAPRKSHASVPSLVSRSTSCSVPSCCYPCLSMYLPASTTQPAAAASSDSSLSRAVNSRCNDVDALLPNAEESLGSQTRWERWWHVVSCRSIWSCFLDRQRVVHSRMRALFHSCAEAWEVLWKPFSVLPSLSLQHHSYGARSLTQPCRPSTQHHRPHAAEDKWTRELLDLSDEEQEGFVAEQEALWGLLEGIERRRRALTGRSLFRQPLPSHRQRRLGGALCFPASCSLSPATAPDQGMAEHQLRAQTTDAASLAVAVIIPTLAVGVPLEFSTDRKARPVLADRQGRWIPVAVIDEEVEYYNYNLDQVLPLA